MNFVSLQNKFKIVLSYTVILAVSSNLFAQIQPEWDASLGGNIWEELNSVEQTADGGFIMAGFTSSSADADVSGINNGGGDYWVVKTDNLGNIQWENNFGGNQLERPWKVMPTTDGGYMVAGYSPSNISGTKTEDSRGGDDYWIVKMDNTGNYQWDRTYGGDGLDFCYDMIQMNDGGYLLGGRSLSGISGEKTEANNGNWDYWLVKINASGDIQWDKTIGGDQEDLLGEMQLSPDGNVIIAGGTNSSMSGDVTSMTEGNKDFWLIKVNSNNGDLIWQRRYGGAEEDEIFSFVQTSDGGFLLGGGSRSNANPPFKSEDNFGVVDMWIVKTDAAGSVEWDRTFGGTGLDNCYSVRQNSINYYIISGFSESSMTGNKTTGTNGGFDYWILYLDNNGTKQWESSLGGAQNDVLENAFQIEDGGYLLAGHSSSDVSGDKMDPSNGNNDFWIIKTVCDVNVALPDTLVCPNEPVLLDVYTETNCIGCTWSWGDISTNDSIRLITTDVTTTYNVTLTDGVGCSREEEMTISVIPTNINVDLEETISICTGESVTLNAENSGNDFLWSTGASTQIINVTVEDTYVVSVTDNNMCTFVDSTLVLVGNTIQVDLGNDTTICTDPGFLFLNAGNPGETYSWSGGENTQNILVNSPGTYAVTVGDASSCSGTDEITLAFFDSPVILSTMTTCNDTNTYYTVVLEIAGGDVNSYNISGLVGTFNGNIFTSIPIEKDSSYSLSLTDGNACPPILMDGVYDCNCSSDAGELIPDAVSICGDSIANIQIVTPAMGDANDIIQYALHENVLFDNNTLVYLQDNPIFEFQTGMVYGQTYYVSALVGNELPVGNILLEDACLGVSNSVPITFYEFPIADIESQSTLEITCGAPTIVLDGSNSVVSGGGPMFFEWTNALGGNIIGDPNMATIEIDAAGTYYLTVSNLAGCSAIDSVETFSDGDLPVIDIIEPVALSCKDSIVLLDASASSSGANFTHVWNGGAITGEDVILNPTVTEPGIYSLTVTNETNGCSVTGTVAVLVNYDTPTANIDPVYYMNCATGMVTMQAFVFPPEPAYSIEWTSEDGTIVSGAEEFIAVGGDIGVYVIEITDSLSGCSDFTVTSILPNEDRPISAWLNWTFPLCLGDSNGTMRVDSVLHGIPPFQYSFNGDPFSLDTFNYELSAGENNITIKDTNGCLWDTTVVFNDGLELFVDLEDPYGFVDLGDSLQLFAFGSEDDIDSIVWTSPIALSCYDCLDPWIHPTDDSISIGLQLFTTDGCTNRDETQVKVAKYRRVYIPNAFSPNGDRKNEFFSVFTNKETKRINYLRVYNRWGGMIYEDYDLNLGDKKNGWNGDHKNERAALPGVYIYIVEVEFKDGEVRKYQGDFTLYK